MRGRSIDGTPTSRAAILTHDTESDVNYISDPLVTKLLNEDVQTFGVNETKRIKTPFGIEDVKGYVYLDWLLQHDQKQGHNT
jgi:hypothetical protein